MTEHSAELPPVARQLDEGLYCIDAGYIEPWFACVYLLGCAGEYALIETGTSYSLPNVLAVLRCCGIEDSQLRYIIPTHIHLDHAGGAGVCMRTFPRAELIVHPRGARHLVDPGRLIESSVGVYGEARFRELYGEIEPVEEARIRTPEDGEVLALGNSQLELRFTRGHANHHFCVWEPRRRAWFTGDMFGICYPWLRFPTGDLVFPSTTPTQFDPVEYAASLRLLDSYGPQCMYLTHSGQLDYSSELLAGLQDQLTQSCTLARQYTGDLPGLAAALEQSLLAAAARLGYVGDAVELRRTLAIDTELNAKGLEIWAQRDAPTGISR